MVSEIMPHITGDCFSSPYIYTGPFFSIAQIVSDTNGWICLVYPSQSFLYSFCPHLLDVEEATPIHIHLIQKSFSWHFPPTNIHQPTKIHYMCESYTLYKHLLHTCREDVFIARTYHSKFTNFKIHPPSKPPQPPSIPNCVARLYQWMPWQSLSPWVLLL